MGKMASDEEYVMTVNDWNTSWSSGHDSTFISEPHPALVENIDTFTAGKKCKIFVPLCGTAIDMKWLADKGHQVIGLECSEVAIIKFFKANNIEFNKEQVDGIQDAVLYKSADGTIGIYQCDLYKFHDGITGKFDCIWDSGSIEAINHKDRESYAKIMISLMAKECKYFIHSFSYDKTKVEFGPYMFSKEDFEELFGGQCIVELLSRYKMPDKFLKAYDFSADSNCYGILHLLTLKQDN
ncbi:probable thiopurine S-methyltransferase isoform X2 [Anneissia japonica]|uniref:probable thiopurine S-methyltransferase isoform X2 n=1 Tax=Anneissia japonica TaxID=1529436 RepID=UPI00142575FD|nr:probable thiopurine S-methyltransferase isoform X2 [Anneissia japonica]